MGGTLRQRESLIKTQEKTVLKPSKEAPWKNPSLLKPRSQSPGFEHSEKINISHRIYWISLDQLYKTYISELLAKGVTWRYSNNLG